jgi:aarF domain-containing kinase
MDYQREACNMISFKNHMSSLDSIVVADVHPELTTREVIVTEWIEGTKLSNCRSQDILELCDALLNCYLIQLLETGFLHADPHPGEATSTMETQGTLKVFNFPALQDTKCSRC